MKKYLSVGAIFTMFAFNTSSFGQAPVNVGINYTGASADPVALLDVSASDKGILIPRVALSSTSSNSPIGAGVVTSLMVYNTATAGDVTPGFYYWNGSAWVRFNGTAINSTNAAITNDASTNADMFLSWVTANSGNLPIKVSSTKLMFNPYNTGKLSIGTTANIGGVDGISQAIVIGNSYAGTPAAQLGNSIDFGTGTNGNANTIKARIIGRSNSGNVNGYLDFYTMNNNTTADVKMTVDYQGFVGIGSNAPLGQLHLASNSNHEFRISRTNGQYGFRIFRDATSGIIKFDIGINSTPTWETKIQIGEGEGSGTNLVLNPSAGNVGIGTASPSQKLQVAGAIRTTGATGAGNLYLFDDNSYGYIVGGSSLSNAPNIHFSNPTRSGYEGGHLSLAAGYNASSGTTTSQYINFYTGNGSERMRIARDGNVGIGTNNPSNAKLEVVNAGGTQARFAYDTDRYIDIVGNGGIRLRSSDAQTNPLDITKEGVGDINFKTGLNGATATRITIKQGGSVGIGTTAPGDILETQKEVSGAYEIRFSQLRSGPANSNSNGDGTHLSFYQRASGALQKNSAIAGVTDGSAGDGRLEFYTRASGAGGVAEHMRITSAGKIGIGTTSPASKLDIEGGVSIGSTYSGTTAAPTDGAIIEGNVGIGTSSPSVKLHVVQSDGGTNGLTVTAIGGNAITGTTSGGGNGVTGSSTSSGIGGYFTSSSGYALITGTGNCGIGTGAPTALLSVNGSANKPGGGSWGVFSDSKLKQNVQPFGDGLSKLLQINPVTFQYNGKAGISSTESYVGVIAQDMQQILPYTVSEVQTKMNPQDATTEGVLVFDPNALMYIMINSIKELNAEIADLKAKVADLEKK